VRTAEKMVERRVEWDEKMAEKMAVLKVELMAASWVE